jgi:hypothetical protein
MRNIVAGVVIAAGISLVSMELAAESCPAVTACAEGTALYGFDIQCDCLGTGSCRVVTPGHEIECLCDQFPATICDCEDGCT